MVCIPKKINVGAGRGGLRVFVVEDEPVIRMLVVDMIEELGCRVVAEAGNIGEAVRLAQSGDFDLAILDVNLHGEMASSAAELIQARGLPLIFATGYGAAGLPAQFRDHAVLQKPFELKALAAAIDEVLASRSP
jgi:CheY-like chemotaxis protein